MKSQPRLRAGNLYPAAAFVYCELLLALLCGTDQGIVARAAVAAGAGLLISGISRLATPPYSPWGTFALTEAVSLAFTVEYFIFHAFKVYMSAGDIMSGSGGVASDFSAMVVAIVVRRFWAIALFHVPETVFLAKNVGKSFAKKRSARAAGFLALSGVTLSVLASAASSYSPSGSSFSTDVSNMGLIYAFALEASGGGDERILSEEAFVSAFEGSSSSEAPSFFGLNILDADMDALAAGSSGTLRYLHEYVRGRRASAKNAYTGLFEGKNLIFITAEAFSAEVIDPQRTPALYRLASSGIVFEDYYQPAWGGSTSTGEFSNLMGIVPSNGVRSMKDTVGHDNSVTIGSKLQELGYFSECYHNGDYAYYGRNETHTGMGYSSYIAMGSGMEEALPGRWPESDLDMMRFTVERYIDRQPFSVYYMTISGHTNYAWRSNSMSQRNRDAVSDLPYSEHVKGYLAANMELEYAMSYLLQRLEEAGIADDTVIVLGTDHYPYGLEKSAAWGTDRDYLLELYGFEPDNCAKRDHSALIIWCGSLEEDPPVISSPVYSLDILPTLCNLFGVAYDSRLLVGRDVFSDTPALVLWPDGCWKTEKGFYDASEGRFFASEGQEVPESGYIREISGLVREKIRYSDAALENDYFRYFNEGAASPER